jgi:hypothetical protein
LMYQTAREPRAGYSRNVCRIVSGHFSLRISDYVANEFLSSVVHV